MILNLLKRNRDKVEVYKPVSNLYSAITSINQYIDLVEGEEQDKSINGLAAAKGRITKVIERVEKGD